MHKLDRLRALFLFCEEFEQCLEGKEKIVEGLIRAMLEERTCRVTCDSFSAECRKIFLIDPLHFSSTGGYNLS